MFLTKTYSSTVSSIDMQPYLVLFTNIRNGVERIKRSHGSATGNGHHCNDRNLLCGQIDQRAFQFSHVHAAMLIQWNTQYL